MFGLGVCFFVNAVSYVAVLVGLSMMRTSELLPTELVAPAKGQIREGFRYVWRTPSLRNTLLAIALIGIFAYNFTVTLALLAKVTFHGGAGTYALLTSCMGIGAVAGGLIAAHRVAPDAPAASGPGPGVRLSAGRGGACPHHRRCLPAHRLDGDSLDRVHRHRQRHTCN